MNTKNLLLQNEIANAARWVQEQANANSFAEIGFKVVLHDSKLNRIEKILIEKMKPTKSGGTYGTDRKV